MSRDIQYIICLVLLIISGGTVGVRVSRNAVMCAPQKVEMPGGKVNLF